MWNEGQQIIRLKRYCIQHGLAFRGFVEDYHGSHTKCLMFCKEHGAWETSTINNIINKGVKCPKCKYQDISTITKERYRSNEALIIKGFKKGAFENDAIERSKSTTSQGYYTLWDVTCGTCGDTLTYDPKTINNNIKKCRCIGDASATYAYIAYVLGAQTEVPVIKFGITKNVSSRISQLNTTNKCLSFLKESYYLFENAGKCTRAETECKRRLKCGVVSKEEMPDGYTETTLLENIEWLKQFSDKLH